MTIFSEKGRFVKSFCAISVASIMALSSLVSVAAAIAAPSANATESSVAPELKTVTFDVDGKTTSVEVSGGTVGDALKIAGIEISKNRIVYPAQNRKITSDLTVKVRYAKPVELTVDGKTRLIVLAYGTVEESLKMAGVELGSDDILNCKRDDKVEKLKNIKIQRVVFELKTETASIPFEKVTKNSDEVELGETKIGIQGKNGEKQIVKKVKYIDGKAKAETVVSEKVVKKPVDEVTLVGTKGAAATGGAGTFTDENGVTVAYKEVFTGSGTAYTAPAGAGTATGVPAYHGGVAIDPNLIPYGSKLYVVSTDGSMVYGYCTAVDTGGFCDDGSAIVDVFYNTYDECVNWGRRDVYVYVIE